jgi:flagellar motor protein MotB
MASVESSPADDPPQATSPETSFRTLADPRNASATDLSRSDSASPRHPDLNSEVAALSDKLINAINHQTTLDDTLTQTRQELEASKARISQLEAEAKAYEERLSRADGAAKDKADEQNNKLSAELAEERRQRTLVQQEKRGIELELETLTASLFDEANKMVASANRDRDAVEKKNQQLRDQIKDGEAVIASQTEQLTELKTLMQQIGPAADYRRDLDSPRVSLAPSSPGFGREENNITRLLEAMNLSPVGLEGGELTPSPHASRPTTLSNRYSSVRGLQESGADVSFPVAQPLPRSFSGRFRVLRRPERDGPGLPEQQLEHQSVPDLATGHVETGQLADDPWILQSQS